MRAIIKDSNLKCTCRYNLKSSHNNHARPVKSYCNILKAKITAVRVLVTPLNFLTDTYYE